MHVHVFAFYTHNLFTYTYSPPARILIKHFGHAKIKKKSQTKPIKKKKQMVIIKMHKVPATIECKTVCRVYLCAGFPPFVRHKRSKQKTELQG